MSDLIEAAILGIVQGLTEFLPVSSTGHLVITQRIFGLSQERFGLRFDAAIHLGTLSAVLVYYWPTLWSVLRAWLLSLRERRWDATPASRLGWLLIIGTIPAGLAGLALQSTAEEAFRSPALVAVMLILFSAPLLLAERLGSASRPLAEAGPLLALTLGVAQSIALVPGVSRSGITISAGMLAGLPRRDAAEFAFLLSAPIIAAAGGKQLFDIATGAASEAGPGLAVYATGLLTAALVGYATIAFLMRYLRFNRLTVFVAYRLALGGLILALVAAGVL